MTWIGRWLLVAALVGTPLAAAGGAPKLTFDAAGAPDARLEGWWRLAAVDGVEPPVEKQLSRGRVLDVRLKDGEVTGTVHCNGFFGPYRTIGNVLETALAQTTAGCVGTVSWDHATMAAMAGGVFEVTNGGRTLTLKGAAGRTYRFERPPPEYAPPAADAVEASRR